MEINKACICRDITCIVNQNLLHSVRFRCENVHRNEILTDDFEVILIFNLFCKSKERNGRVNNKNKKNEEGNRGLRSCSVFACI